LTLPVLVAGLVLRLTHGWFSGQHTVGDICLWVGAIGIALQLALFVGVDSIVGKVRR
jgi:hypothetical protein